MTKLFNIFLIGLIFGATFQAVSVLKILNNAMAVQSARAGK